MRLWPLIAALLSGCCLEVTSGFAENDAGAPPVCQLVATTLSAEFDRVQPGIDDVVNIGLTNSGGANCNVTASLAPGTDPGFTIASNQSAALKIPVGGTVPFLIGFEIGALAPPVVRTGTLIIANVTPGIPPLNVALKANLPGCNLVASRPVLNFGNISPDGSATDNLTLVNDGGLECDVTDLALAAGTDPGYSLPAQTTSFSIPVGGSAPVFVTFTDSSGGSPPNSHTGTLDVSNSDLSSPTLQIPLQAYVNPACTTSGRWIWVLDDGDAGMARFDPTTLTFTNIGVPNCPDGTGAFSMAVDENGIAWALYQSGNLYRIDTSDASCQATSFSPVSRAERFGMSFLFNSLTGVDSLYIANQQLGTIAFPSLALSYIAPLDLGPGELAGTGDGELWDFVVSSSTLYQLDPATAQVLQTWRLGISVQGGFAMKFWGGSFWIFIDDAVFQVPRSTGIATQVVSNDGYNVVGAGVSDCAPVQ